MAHVRIRIVVQRSVQWPEEEMLTSVCNFGECAFGQLPINVSGNTDLQDIILSDLWINSVTVKYFILKKLTL